MHIGQHIERVKYYTDRKSGIHMVCVVVNCPKCDLQNWVDIDFDSFMDWQSGTSLQVAWTNSTPEERELLMSGICPDCWDTLLELD